MRGRRGGGGGEGASTHYIWGVTFLTLSVLGFYMPQFVKTLLGLLFFQASDTAAGQAFGGVVFTKQNFTSAGTGL